MEFIELTRELNKIGFTLCGLGTFLTQGAPEFQTLEERIEIARECLEEQDELLCGLEIEVSHRGLNEEESPNAKAQ